jgi:hypothetical protein
MFYPSKKFQHIITEEQHLVWSSVGCDKTKCGTDCDVELTLMIYRNTCLYEKVIMDDEEGIISKK